MEKNAGQINKFITAQVARLTKIIYVYFKPNLEDVPTVLSSLFFKNLEGLELTNVQNINLETEDPLVKRIIEIYEITEETENLAYNWVEPFII